MHDRVLSGKEVCDWVGRLQGLAGGVGGPVYVLWGTDFEDAPIINAGNLHAVRCFA